jgi:hypothetical protein
MRDEDWCAGVRRYSRGHAAQQRGLHAREAARPEHDRRGVEFVGRCADRLPRLAVGDPSGRLEAGIAGELDAPGDIVLTDLVGDLVELEALGQKLPEGGPSPDPRPTKP